MDQRNSTDNQLGKGIPYKPWEEGEQEIKKKIQIINFMLAFPI